MSNNKKREVAWHAWHIVRAFSLRQNMAEAHVWKRQMIGIARVVAALASILY